MKSPPELWAECSDATSLSRHLNDCFGEIRITRLEPETAVAWEGEHGSGTVRLEPSGWGTRVILTAQTGGEAADPAAPTVAGGDGVVAGEAPVSVAGEAPPISAPPPSVAFAPAVPASSPAAMRPTRQGLIGRLFSRHRSVPAPAVPADPPEPPRPAALEPSVPPASAEMVVAARPVAAPHPADDSPPATDPPSTDPAVPDPAAALTAALDSLGQAHHRPFSRA